MLVLFHMATQLKATLEITQVRLGLEGYCVQLKVTKPEFESVDADLIGFLEGLNFFDEKKALQKA